ncbi:sensor histidine kinase [Verrucomicrobiales bacterium BCK34]|nr:sensor histidine kinase [Verrucomicrobiales bacterium BCK34]
MKSFCLLLFAIGLAVSPASGETLKSAIAVRSLDFERADSGIPVDLTAVVIFTDFPGTVFIQDETSATFFQLQGRVPPAVGDVVRVRGRTAPGLYLPGIESATFEVVGEGVLPPAPPVQFEELQSGRLHYQRVMVEGIVRTIVPDDEGTSLMTVTLGSRIIEVKVDSLPIGESHYIGAKVRMVGLAAGDINHRRQLVRPYLRCSGWSDIEILEAGPELQSLPVVTPEDVMTFAVGGQELKRVSLRGFVTGVFPGGTIYLRSGDAGIAVRVVPGEPSVKLGDKVVLAGFPEMNRYTATLVDSVILEEPVAGAPLLPRKVSVPEILNGNFDSELVIFSAVIVDWFRSDSGYRIVLKDGDHIIQATSLEIDSNLARGAKVEVTGIGVVEKTRRSGEYRSAPEQVVLRLRSTADLRIVEAPGWWTPRRLVIALVGLVAIGVAALSWVFLLRRQVKRQTMALRSKIENEAVLEERQRIAREFHDSLEQDLAGLSLRLDAAGASSSNEKVLGFIKGSRGLVSRIQNETRSLVVDLRESPGGTMSLPGALAELVDSGEGEVGPKVLLSARSEEVTLLFPSRVVHHLKMIARESVTNAMKHSGSEIVEIDLRVEEEQLILTISDDGSGFDFGSETRGKSGHFGCMGMRERARKIEAEIEWRVSGSGGTMVEVCMPLKAL